MQFWVSLLAVAGAFAASSANSVALPSGGSIQYSPARSKTRFAIRTKQGRRYQVSVARDGTVAPRTSPSEVKLVADLKGAAWILTDTYASIPGGMSYCQAGEERFLRVLGIAHGSARETLQVKLASCRDNIELADPGIEWNAETNTLRIHWLSAPKGQPNERTIRLAPDGTPVA
ncbi:MAG: hypothetical protein ACLQVN_25290 [Bryobacteraceae bacterium]